MADWLSQIEIHEGPPYRDLGGRDRFRLTINIMRDPRVGSWMKWVVPIVTILYIVSPVNIIPDFQLGAGELDDLLVAAFTMVGMMRLVPLITPSAIVDEHLVKLHKKS